jgi:hypothetical protein
VSPCLLGCRSPMQVPLSICRELGGDGNAKREISDSPGGGHGAIIVRVPGSGQRRLSQPPRPLVLTSHLWVGASLASPRSSSGRSRR